MLDDIAWLRRNIALNTTPAARFNSYHGDSRARLKCCILFIMKMRDVQGMMMVKARCGPYEVSLSLRSFNQLGDDARVVIITIL